MTRQTKKTKTHHDLPADLLGFFRRFSDDAACRAYLEQRRWPDGPVCPHCKGGKPVYTITSDKARSGLHKCGACRKQFTVTVGTIFEGSHVPLSKWFAALYLMSSSKKGISAHQLHRGLGLTYKTAWFLCHRIRHAMRTRAFRSYLSGTVEVDETYVGAKKPGKRGRGAAGKTIVLGMVKRGGDVNARIIPDVKRRTLRPIIAKTVRKGSRLMSDDLSSYLGLSDRYRHGVVAHSRGYVAGKDIHVNTAESFFALLKRGLHGTFHHVGKHKLDMYCGEFGFRWNTRHVSDGERFMDALTHTDGRLRWFFKTAPASAAS